MDLNQRIIEVSDEILMTLLEFKKRHPDFTFSLRTKDSPQSNEPRLSIGRWFQGSNYIYVPLFKKGDQARKIKTIGFVLNFKPDLSIEKNHLEISFKAGINAEEEVAFHQALAKRLGVQLNEKNFGSLDYPNPTNYLENLNDYITRVRSITLELLEEHGLTKTYVISEEKFQKDLQKIHEIRKKLNKNIHDLQQPKLGEYLQILEHKKQIILQGPPGTGKTYTAKDLAEQMIFGDISTDKKTQKKRLEDTNQFELLQFHPSYSYEDFVRGIVANSEESGIRYETENKTLAKIAEKAQANWNDARKEINILAKEQQIIVLFHQFVDEVDAAIEFQNGYTINQNVSIVGVEPDAFRYSGGNWGNSLRMKFKDLILAQINGVTTRKAFRTLEGISGLGKQHASYFIKVLNQFQKAYESQLSNLSDKTIEKPKLKKFVLLIDEINRANLPSVLGELVYALEYRGETVTGMYAIDGNKELILPENLYIIGTMNTADRSVGHIDYAIRRRFAFIDILPTIEVIQHPEAQKAFQKMTTLFVKEEEGKKRNSKHLAPDFDYKEVQLGHSYFMLRGKAPSEQLHELKMRLQYEIVPILNEYIKDGILLESAKSKIEKLVEFE